MFARVWTSAPHDVDGYYVELVTTYGKRKLQFIEDSTWCKTVAECKEWAVSKGATHTEEK